jgi:hypothetical protein
LCTGVEPAPPDAISRAESAGAERRTPAPHDYGVAVMLLGVADRVVPSSQVDALRAGVRRFLWASHLDRVDKPQAESEFAAIRALAERMPEPSATLLGYVVARDVPHLGHRLLPLVGVFGGDAALSPSRSTLPSAPVFLLHGQDDNVIPAAESVFLAQALRPHGDVRVLLSDLISHAEADRAVTFGNITALAEFWGDLLWR